LPSQGFRQVLFLGLAEGPDFIALDMPAGEIGEADVLKVGTGTAEVSEQAVHAQGGSSMHTRPTHPSANPPQDKQSWSRWGIAWSAAIVTGLGLTLLSFSTVQARTFQCRAGDTACLIASIQQANVQPGSSHEIRLEAGIYTLTAVDNDTDGPNGLPSITCQLTIRGAGDDLTILERNGNAPLFRLIHVAATGTLTLEGLTIEGFAGSRDISSPGGGLYNRGTVILSNVAVRHNFAYCSSEEGFHAGGGLYNRGTLTLSNTIIADNAGHCAGGGLANVGGTVRISQSSIARNGSIQTGGVHNAQGGMVTLTNTAVFGNGATDTAGLYNEDGRVTITNSTFEGNSALGVGALANNGTLTLVNTTVADNIGVGLASSGGTTVLVNTILAHNVSSSASDCLGAITSQGNNLIGDLTGCTVTLQSTDRLGEPGLGPFSDDETPGNGHFPLLFTSQAINKGNPAVCPKTDQLGEKRVGPCDIGAIEFQGTAVSSR
jgi:hypothetical protein